MATNIKPFNSVGGYSVGPNLVPFLDANNNANVANLTVNGTANLANLNLSGNIVADNITANATLTGEDLVVGNSGNITGTLFVGGNVTANSNLVVTTNANIGGTSNVVGAATFGNTVGITGVLTTTTDANIGGDINLTGDANLSSNLAVGGDANITGTLAAGATTINGNLAISNAVGTNGILVDHLYYSNGVAWDLQEAAGSNTQIQFNTDGNFGASANFTFDSATNQLTVTGTANVTSNLYVGDSANIGNALNVTGESIFGSQVTVSAGDLTVNDGLTVHGAVIFDIAAIDGAIQLGNASTSNVVIGGASVGLGPISNLHITGGSNGQYLQTNGSGNLVWATVDTDTLANGNTIVSIDVVDGPVLFQVNGNANVMVVNETSVDFAGNVNVVGTVTADTFYSNTLADLYDLEVRNNASITGNITGFANLDIGGTTVLDGELTVTGASNIANTLLVLGAANINNTLSVSNTLTGLQGFELTGTANVGNLTVNALTDLGNVGNITIDGGANGQILVTDGAGNLSWSSAPNVSIIQNGTSNVTIPTTDGNVAINVNGGEQVVFSGGLTQFDGNVTANGTAGIEGDLTVGSLGGAQSNALVYGNITGNLNLNLQGDANIVGNASADAFIATGDAGQGGTLFGTGNGVQLYDTNFAQLNYSNTNYVFANASGLTFEVSAAGAQGRSTVDAATGDWTFANNVTVTADANIQGNLQFVDANGTSVTLSSSLTTANLSANGGNVSLGQVANLHILGGSDGQVLKTDGNGVLSWSSNVNVSSIVNGTSNVSIPDVNGNIYMASNGQANIITIQSNGTFATTTITDDVLVTGNLTVQGNVTNIDTTNLNVEDPVITEGRGPNNAPLTLNDGLDRGLYSWYYDGAEKGGFIGYKNAGAFAGDYIIATDATLSNNVVSVNTYANVVVSGIISGPAGNTAGGVSRIDMGTGANIAFRVDGEADVLNITKNDISANANVAVAGNVGVTGGNITVTGGTSGAYGSQVNLTTAATVGPTVTTTIGSGSVVTASSTPAPLVTVGDAEGRTVEFFISARDQTNPNYEGAKYLVVSDGTGNVDWTSYGTVRIGLQTQQVAVTFSSDGTDLQARVAVLDNSTTTQFSTQYQIVG